MLEALIALLVKLAAIALTEYHRRQQNHRRRRCPRCGVTLPDDD